MTMELQYDYVTDDPCYGCRFAVKKTEEQIKNDGMLSRRFVCSNLKRRDEMELDIIRAIVERDYNRATHVLSTLVDSLRCGNGLLKVVEATVPFCYQKKEETK